MPWRVTSPMYQRQRFVLDAEHTPAAFAELCRRYGISRKTGYKWLHRYARLGPDSLADRSHRPQQCPHATAPAVIREILSCARPGAGALASSTSSCSRPIPRRRFPPLRPSITSWFATGACAADGAPKCGRIQGGPRPRSLGPTWSGRLTSRASSGSAMAATAIR